MADPSVVDAPVCVEREGCTNAWHYWRCPEHHDYGKGNPEPSVVDAPGPKHCNEECWQTGMCTGFCKNPPALQLEDDAEPSVVDALNTLRDLFNNVGHSPTCQWGECPCREFGDALAVVETALADLRRAFNTEVRVCSERTQMLYAAEARAVAAEADRDEIQRLATPIVNKLIDGSYGRNATVTKTEIDALRAVLASEEST